MFAPYGQAGQAALSQLMNGFGLGGAGGSEAFTQAYRSLPGYQAGLDTGTRAGSRIWCDRRQHASIGQDAEGIAAVRLGL